jgi:hypothetical protein
LWRKERRIWTRKVTRSRKKSCCKKESGIYKGNNTNDSNDDNTNDDNDDNTNVVKKKVEFTKVIISIHG